MMRKFILISFIVVSFCGYAQEKIFLNQDSDWTTVEDATQYAIATKESDSVILVDFFTLDDVLKSSEYYSVFKKHSKVKDGLSKHFYPDGADSLVCVYEDNKRVGQSVIYYPDGQEKIVAGYSNGMPHGFLAQYYPDGKIRRKEMYVDAVCIRGELLDEEGNKLPFEPYFMQPEFPGGVKALMRYLSKSVNYPVVAQENGMRGKILVDFVVEKDGTMSSVQARNFLAEPLNTEALRVVNEMSTRFKWQPGTEDGIPIRVRFVLPIVFGLW